MSRTKVPLQKTLSFTNSNEENKLMLIINFNQVTENYEILFFILSRQYQKRINREQNLTESRSTINFNTARLNDYGSLEPVNEMS